MTMRTKTVWCVGLVLATIIAAGRHGACAGEVKPIHRAESLPPTTPWDLAALSKAPKLSWGEGTKVRSLYYRGERYKGKDTRVFAYYATPGTLSGEPARDKNLPAVVLVHGGGGTAFARWAELWASRGYAAIAMDLSGRGPNRVRLADGGPDQGDNVKFGAIDQPVTDQWTYHAVADVILAHSLILSFPEVDSDRTALTGISWGGYLTCIVAGLDNRFKAAVPVYGCGFLHENSVWLPRFAKMSPDDSAKWVRLWDPSRYVGSAAMEMLFVNGGKDFAYPPDSYAKTYDLVRSPKNIHFVPDLRHGHIFDKPKAVEVFIRQRLENGVGLARIAAPEIRAGQVVAKVDTKTKLISAALHYTVNKVSEGPAKRVWAKLPAAIDRNVIRASLPPDGTRIWFLTITDERDTTVSTRPMFPVIGKPLLPPATTAPATRPDKWEKAIRAFEDADRNGPPPTGGIVFVGSSSIRMWDTARYFPDLVTIQRGFGGSEMADSVKYCDRIVTRYKPRTVVVYAGDNDISAGLAPEQVLKDYQAFVAKVHASLPKTRIIYIAIKPSIRRWKLAGRMRQANALIAQWTATDKRLGFLDIDKPMIGADGKPRKELFKPDGLHLNHEGYVLWSSLLRPMLAGPTTAPQAQ